LEIVFESFDNEKMQGLESEKAKMQEKWMCMEKQKKEM